MVKKDDTRDMEFASAEELQETTEVEIEYLQLEHGKWKGKWVALKPLNRKQALRFKGNRKMPRDLFEQRIVSIAMINPNMTVAQISGWQDVDPADGDLRKITDTIIRISGMAEESSKREETNDNDL